MEHWPGVFARYMFFVKHPYFLPCAIMSTFTLFVFITVFIGMREVWPVDINVMNHRN